MRIKVACRTDRLAMTHDRAGCTTNKEAMTSRSHNQTKTFRSDKKQGLATLAQVAFMGLFLVVLGFFVMPLDTQIRAGLLMLALCVVCWSIIYCTDVTFDA